MATGDVSDKDEKDESVAQSSSYGPHRCDARRGMAVIATGEAADLYPHHDDDLPESHHR